jgi:O-antigen biosynthesis protein
LDLSKILQDRRLKPILNPMSNILIVAKYGSVQSFLKSFNFSTTDLLKNQELMNQSPSLGDENVRTINWFIPYFNHPYGGIYTILRFANFFGKEKKVKNRLIFYGFYGNPIGSKTEIKIKIGKVFPDLLSHEIIVLEDNNNLDTIPPSDACIATFWTSAYLAMKFNNTRRKFYFIQDFEPLFYPGGIMYGLAEATYRFGFHGITNMKELRDLYVDEYGKNATYFKPSLDRNVFFPSEKTYSKPSIQKPFNIFFYTRTGMERNAFELGTAALKEIKKKYRELVKIYAAGCKWYPNIYGLENVVTNLGVLPFQETAKLYRKCDLGIVLGYTMGTGYIALELMACGCPVLVNYSPNNKWFYKDSFNCLVAEPSISCILEKTDFLMNNPLLSKKIVSNAQQSLPQTSWEHEMEKIYGFICNPHPKYEI